ncbi:MAG: sugar phosphate isomerase/epimerase [Candidatus Hydrogenedentales bacterium]
MAQSSMNRRQFFQAGATAGAALAATSAAVAQEPKKYQGGLSQWPLVLNASTIRPTPLKDKIRVTAEAGYDGIELWVKELEEYEKAGGNLTDLGKEIADLGLSVPNVIGLWDSMPPTQEEWEKILPTSRDRMRMSAAVKSKHVAALPFPDRENFEHRWGTDRYRDLLKIGREEYGILPALEFVGFVKGVNRLGFASGMAIDANDSDAAIVADTFHLYRGGSGFNGVKHLNGSFIADFHWNDISADVPQDQAADEHRIYPGDGILPLVPLLKDLASINYTGPLSLELFNREHWAMDPKIVAETGLRKMREVIEKAQA